MDNVRVTLVDFETGKPVEIKSTKEIIQEALDLAHRDFSKRKISEFIEKYIYLGNGHLLVVETLAKNGFKRTAKVYLKTFLYDFLDEESRMNISVPLDIDYEAFDRGIPYVEWVREIGL